MTEIEVQVRRNERERLAAMIERSASPILLGGGRFLTAGEWAAAVIRGSTPTNHPRKNRLRMLQAEVCLDCYGDDHEKCVEAAGIPQDAKDTRAECFCFRRAHTITWGSGNSLPSPIEDGPEKPKTLWGCPRCEDAGAFFTLEELTAHQQEVHR